MLATKVTTMYKIIQEVSIHILPSLYSPNKVQVCPVRVRDCVSHPSYFVGQLINCPQGIFRVTEEVILPRHVYCYWRLNIREGVCRRLLRPVVLQVLRPTSPVIAMEAT